MLGRDLLSRGKDSLLSRKKSRGTGKGWGEAFGRSGDGTAGFLGVNVEFFSISTHGRRGGKVTRLITIGGYPPGSFLVNTRTQSTRYRRREGQKKINHVTLKPEAERGVGGIWVWEEKSPVQPSKGQGGGVDTITGNEAGVFPGGAQVAG